MTTNLDQIVLGLLEARRGDWQTVATASGVSYSWLSKFANGHIDNPGFATLMKLHAELIKPGLPTASENATDPITEGV